ncbi:MAG: ABC transporter ATP-binding protein [Lautropia sp.]
MTSAAVRLEGVTFRYPGSGQGVQDIDLSIEEGELLVCVGPSGCGKTTLLRLIAGFVAPDRGRILLAGVDQAAVAPRQRDCGIVFQSYALFPTMRVWENVAYPLRVRGVATPERRRRALDMLELTGLAAQAERMPTDLSGGQQQRVALARALVFEPKALLLDEPLSALDASTRVHMREEIRRLQRLRGIATLLITHDQDEALSMGDRVAVLRDGRLEQVAPPRTLYDAPASVFVAGFVGRANLFDATVRSATSVDSSVGRLEVSPQTAPPGTRVRLLIRPERIRPIVASQPVRADELVNRFRIRILRDSFHGAVRQLEVEPVPAAPAANPSANRSANPTTAGAAAATPLRIETAAREDFDEVAIPSGAIQFLPAE